MPKKVNCGNKSIIDLINKIIEKLKNDKNKDEAKKVQDALDNYLDECTICTNEGYNDDKCHNLALTKLMRQMPFVRDSVYPWKNYDWDYGNFIDNNYSAKATGSSDEGSKYINNLFIFFKLGSAYLFDPNPGNDSVPGNTDAASDYPIYGCEGNDEKLCKAYTKVRNNKPQNKPYNDDFFDRKLDGVVSSSYYIKVGTCKQPDYSTEKECTKNDFVWSGDACYSPRYAFINNTPGLKMAIPGDTNYNNSVTIGKGLIPSLANDALALTPDKVFNAMVGNNVPGYLEVQPCPKSGKTKKNIETFKTIYEDNLEYLYILSGVVICLSSFMIYYLKKHSK